MFMEAEKNMQRIEEKKDILKTPLSEGQKHIIYSAIEDSNVAEDVINIIEHTIKSSISENKFDLIVEALNPLIQDKAKHIVGKLYIYKRRPCKYNDKCINENCIYTHDKELKGVNKKRKLDDMVTRSKPDVSKSNEVIFNKVDSFKHTETDIKSYASLFGTLISLKKLNISKWLLIFENENMAKKLVESRTPVMEDESIKKYYNIVENLKKYELNNLIEKTENLLNQLDRSSVTEEIRLNFNKIKQMIKEDNQGVQPSKEINKTKNNVQSLYFNSF